MSKFVILHKKKDTLNRLCCIMKVTKQTLQHLRKKVPLANTIHHSAFIYNQLKKLNLCTFYSNRVINHLISILKKHLEILKHYVLSSAQMYPYLHRRSFPVMCVDGRSRYFSGNVKTVWHWIHTRSVSQRKYRDTGC